ncbi:MAG: S8 family serine peptidase [Scytonema sp. PMC 1069.18]|nr:S8 family serine peptidase [Scytonema sp. PMC 1069.18]MEC4885544.1 S8 family serine peptidase [Scytonema sp. PMC 1070.18]
MEQGNYIVLRNTNRVDLSEPYAGFASRSLSAIINPSIRIDVESLNKRDITDLRRDPEVVNIAPPIPTKLIKPFVSQETETTRESNATWGVIATGADKSPFTGKGAIVAVLDTGIDANHEAFKGVKIVQKDFTGEGDGDKQGHGTHCAGTIFGQVVNGYRFGVAPGVERALIGKVLDSEGGGTTEQIYRGILWALDQGAHVISMSLGMDFPGLVKSWVDEGMSADLATSKALESYRANVRLFDSLAALIRARGSLFQPSLIVAAAGNESDRQTNPDHELAVAPPAAADGIVSVGALQTKGAPYNALTIAYFSNTGPNICAPGVDIYSAKTKGGYFSLDGTSMATPHVAGITALWIEKLLTENTQFSVTELTSLLIGRATKTKLAPGYDPMDIGAGLVQAPLE